MEAITRNLTATSLIGASPGEATARTFRALNPVTGEPLDPPFHAVTCDEVRRAARLAAEAFADYRQRSGAERAAFLREIAGQIEMLGDQLTERMTLETGLPAARATAERGRTCGQLRMFAGLVEEGSWVNARIDRADPGREPLPKPDTRWMLRALGPVAVFGPANFPLAFGVAGGDTASALAAGCPVIAKAHPSHPGTSALVGRAIRRAVEACGLPEGVFSMLLDDRIETGVELARAPEIKALAFTGSHRAGRALLDVANARAEPIPVFAEMGSVNPVFLLPGALRERGRDIAAGLQASVCLGAGQFCTNPGLVLMVAGDLADDFAGWLSQLMAQAAPGTMLNRGIATAYADGLARWRHHREVETLAGDDGTGGTQAGAALFRTSAASLLNEPDLASEVFGPATLLVTGTRAELRQVAASLEGQLTATLHATRADLQEHGELVALLETKAGRLLFNGFPTGVEVCASMHHGGPYPATTDARFTSVGTAAIYRFARPVCFQNCPVELLPDELRDGNPLGILRQVDGAYDVPA